MRRIILKLVSVSAIGAAAMFGQFSSGSTGADGPLSFTTPGTIDFDPVALGINAAGDNIFNFTTITIGTGVTLRLRASKVRNAPVLWLATGAVTISGTIDLSGGPGADWNGTREPSEPGPGGYAGGVGGSISSPPTSGAGPGGGNNSGYGCGGNYATSANGCSGPAYGNVLLIPLRGGSGGGGGVLQANDPGAGGGAGGGAIQIVSSSTITINGSILSNGGVGGAFVGYCGGAGSGGAIHLQSQTIAGTGTISAAGSSSCLPSSYGRIRIDATTKTFTGTITPTASFGAPFNTPLPTTNPVVRLISINSVAVPAAPAGNFTNPDVTINSNAAVNINIAGANIPLGTIVKLYLNSETGSDQVISCAALAGTVASSTAICSATFPLGTTATLARAVW